MKADSHIAPYFSSRIEPVFGLNHLRLRNAAEDLFTILLPGLNGVTQRVRYYSFYCWIAGEFIRRFTGDERTDPAFRLFIRKSEMLLALIQARRDRSISGIPGITYALGTLELENDSIDLLLCVYGPDSPRHTKGTYWANPGGVLSQYYGASLKDMAILSPLEGFSFAAVPSGSEDPLPDGTLLGEDLGAAFQESIGSETAALFVSCVLRSRVSRDELDAMKDHMVMKDFGAIGAEREMLIKMLEQKDFPANEADERTLRLKTIRHFLLYCLNDRLGNERDSIAFPAALYRKVIDGDLHDDECALGWYAYHLNDEWQYHSTVIFYRMMQLLKDQGWVSIQDVSNRLAQEMYRALLPEDGVTLGDVADLIGSGAYDERPFKSPDEKAGGAMVSLLRLYCENRKAPDAVDAYRAAFRVFWRNTFFEYMTELDGMMEIPFLDFLKDYVIRKIIYRHHTVSLLKYSATHVASNKFLLEDGFLLFINQVDYTHTAPRIDPLIEYLTDLGLLRDMMPTEDAINRYALE